MKTLAGSTSSALASGHVPMAQAVRMFLPRTNTVQPGNSLLYSAARSNAAWVKQSGTSVTANSALCPDGSISADLLTIGTASNGLYQLASGAINTAYTVSMCLKAGSVNSVHFGITNQTEASVIYYTFDLTGAADPVAHTQSGFITVSATMVSEGAGWYTCTVTGTTPGSGITTVGPFLRATGVTTGNLYLWASQLEQSNAATNYIPTVATAVYGDTIALATANRDIRYACVTYRGANGLGSISQIEDSAGEIKGLSFQMSLTSATQMSLALDGADLWQGSTVQIFTVILENTNYTVLDGMLEWAGIGDMFSIEESANGAYFNATAESFAVDLLRGSPMVINQADQLVVDVTDTAFKYVTDQVGKQVIWPTREWFLR